MSTRIKVNMKPISTIVNRLGVGKDGDVQRHVTSNISNHLRKYIPKRGGVLENSKYITSATTIEVIQPYARYMYYGEVVVDPVTRAAGFQDKDGQWKSRNGIPKVRSGRPINYDTSKKPLAGAKWDVRMMANEKDQIVADVQEYVNRKAGKR